MSGIFKTVSTKAKIIQNIYWRNATCVVQLTTSTIKGLQLFFQKHIILFMLITRKLSSRWNLADNATGLNKFNWRGKNLWAATSQSRSHRPELQIYGSGSSPVRGILRSTLTKTIVFEQTGSMNKIRNLATAAKFGLVNHTSLTFTQGCQIKFRLSSTFDFHPR